MTSITQNNVRYLPHELKTRLHAVETYRNGNSIEYVCRKYHISRTSLWRWNKKYNGTPESLMDGSHRPKSKHPNAHTDEEVKWIKALIKRNPHITLCELWIKLKRNKGYTRHIVSLYRLLRRIGFYNQVLISGSSKKQIKHYETPKQLGIKWQIDVKYVPNECKTNNLPDDIRFYQYTCIDEASRERFLYWYTEHTPESTVDFIKKCIDYYKYKPEEIQTDNGIEFTYNQEKVKVIHPMDKYCLANNIYHHKIRPRTPRHNGKVERSHRNDNERFYSFLSFYSLEDLRYQGKLYLKRSNNIPMQVLNFLSPIEMRNKLLQL